MITMVEYLSRFRQPLPEWLDSGNFRLRSFFKSRTVFYPGSGMDGHALSIFNGSRSAHCYFFVDQEYTAPNPLKQLGNVPTGYDTVFEKHYSARELKQESIYPLPEDDLKQFTTAPICDGPRVVGCQPPSGMRAAADAGSAVRLLVYERNPRYDENHGAKRFAVFCLGMEARTAYEWFYGTMFRGHQPFAALLQDHGFWGRFREKPSISSR